MAYDEALTDRIRELVGAEPRLSEQKMFGGLAFLIGGNMCVAASGQGGVQQLPRGRRTGAQACPCSARDRFDLLGVSAGASRTMPAP